MTADESVDVRPVFDGLLAAARDGLSRSTWRVGDSDEKLLLPIIGALTVHLAKGLRVNEMPPDEHMLRSQIAEELRRAAGRHPAGTARHAAYLEAAQIAEQGEAS
ncbi:hypothetical protein ACWGH4_00195 [Streptomyces sp. NPDC054847]